MIRRGFVVSAVGIALLVFAAATYAGDYHRGNTLNCQDCHIMHYSQSHPYNGGSIFPPLADGPNHYLLRQSPNHLCLACHDGQSFYPDVLGPNAGSNVRQAGALNEDGATGDYADTHGHSLGSIATAPGGTFAAPGPPDGDGLWCGNCHGVHGGGLDFSPTGDNGWNDPQGSYRNLGGFGTVSSSIGISYQAGGVNGLDQWVYIDSPGAYDVSAVVFNEPNEATSQYANYCKACHTDFHGDVGGPEIGGTGTPPEEFVRHPAGGVQIGAIGGGHSNIAEHLGLAETQVQVMSPDGLRAGEYGPGDLTLTPSCMSCHKGHGNKNPFGLIYMNFVAGTGGANQASVTEEGSAGGGYKTLCKQCHVQG